MSGYYLHSRRAFELYIGRPQLLLVLEYILYSVRYVACVQDEIPIAPGQCLLKYEELARGCSVSVSQVRTALKHFVTDGGISIEGKGRRGILITLLPPFSCEGAGSRAREKAAERPKPSGNTYKRTAPQPDPDASYDLVRAEERARSRPPVLKKRKW